MTIARPYLNLLEEEDVDHELATSCSQASPHEDNQKQLNSGSLFPHLCDKDRTLP